MLFVAVLLCDIYANCADIMQVVLLLCKLWVFYANSAVLMQIVLFWCKLWHFTIYAVLSQMTFLSRNTRFSRHFRVCYQALVTFNDVWGRLPVVTEEYWLKAQKVSGQNIQQASGVYREEASRPGCQWCRGGHHRSCNPGLNQHQRQCPIYKWGDVTHKSFEVER